MADQAFDLTEIRVVVWCSECGTRLYGTVQEDGFGGLAAYVDPCPVCLQLEFEKAYEIGQSEPRHQ